jgi:hypothetical protein
MLQNRFLRVTLEPLLSFTERKEVEDAKEEQVVA